jgi:hypothetical protein
MDTGRSFPCDSLSPAGILLVDQQIHISRKRRNLHSDRMTKNQTKILTLLSSGAWHLEELEDALMGRINTISHGRAPAGDVADRGLLQFLGVSV